MVGELAEADKLVAEYVDWAVKTLGPDTPTADRLSGLAVRVCADLGRLDDAVTRGEKVLETRRKQYDAGH